MKKSTIWINDKVIYTPEIVNVIQLPPVEATVEALGTDGTMSIKLADGTVERVENRLCSLAE